ncbi:MAG TPA: hypothetical protein PK369_05075 [Thermoclostridium sp.]|nr:hypothetical protein [Thermoclostridium sp.]
MSKVIIMWIKRILALTMAIIIYFSAAGCVPREAQTKKVGISLPELPSERWREEGEYMKQLLEKDGYEVDLRYNNAAGEIENIKSMNVYPLQG